MGTGNETVKSLWRESHPEEAGPNSYKCMYFLQVHVRMGFETYSLVHF